MGADRIVVVGASAGGVEALSALVGSFPNDLDAVVVVVLHVSATARSVLPQILSRAQTLGATYPRNEQKLQTGRIYVAPPDHHLLVNERHLLLNRGPRVNSCRPAVDPLFRSAAVHFRERAIGVILSGTLDDGSEGLRAIKQAGGIAIVQSPEESLFDSMPRSAIQATVPDYIVPAAEMGPIIEELLMRKPLPGPAPDEASVEFSIEDMDDISESIKTLGNVSEFACPECGGSLWEISEEKRFRFRCRVGHAYSAKHLLDEQTVHFDRALWTALRALRERADLSRRLARRFRATNNSRTAERYDLQARQSQDEANALFNLMRQAHIAIDPALEESDDMTAETNGADSEKPA